jgi:hypothetical protein
VAILQGCRQPELARRFLQFLAATERVGPAPAPAADSPEADSLLADLLGATLVDAQDELWAAWSALARVNPPEPALRWMTEPPPWPPASVAKILSRQGERAMAMVETLAGELSAQPPVRAWLIRSWLSPTRVADEALLNELATAAEGRLCHEPSFRDWLRAEWTAWARQRYQAVGSRQWEDREPRGPYGESAFSLRDHHPERSTSRDYGPGGHYLLPTAYCL